MYKDTGPTDGQGSKAKRLLSAQPARRHRLHSPPPRAQGSLWKTNRRTVRGSGAWMTPVKKCPLHKTVIRVNS